MSIILSTLDHTGKTPHPPLTKNKNRDLHCVMVASFLLLLLIGCHQAADNSDNSSLSDSEIKIVATTNIVGDFVSHIWHDIPDIHITTLMRPGVDPHLYKATPKDIQKLQEADIIIYSGLHLEGKLQEVLTTLGNSKPTFGIGDFLEASTLIYPDNVSEYPDPHFWFDLNLWSIACGNATQKLIELYPQYQTQLQHNIQAYQAKLDEADKKAMLEIQKIPEPSRLLITSHDAFHYLGQRYEIRVQGIQGISTLSKADIPHIEKLAATIKKHNIHTIFTETSVSPKAIERLAELSGAKVGPPLFSDSIGELDTPEGSLPGAFWYNIRSIAEGLSDE